MVRCKSYTTNKFLSYIHDNNSTKCWLPTPAFMTIITLLPTNPTHSLTLPGDSHNEVSIAISRIRSWLLTYQKPDTNIKNDNEISPSTKPKPWHTSMTTFPPVATWTLEEWGDISERDKIGWRRFHQNEDADGPPEMLLPNQWQEPAVQNSTFSPLTTQACWPKAMRKLAQATASETAQAGGT